MEYTQLKQALLRLDAMRKRYAQADDYDALLVEALRESVAQLFEYTLEVAWKTCKRHLSEQGFAEAATGSPKSIMRLAFDNALVDDAAPCLRYIDARQSTAHDYSEKKLDYLLALVDSFFNDATALYEAMSGERWTA